MATVTVLEWERVLHYRDGRLVDVLGPGRHRYRRNRYGTDRNRLITVDLRPRLLTVPGQEVLTSDGIGIRLSAVAVWRIGDPKTYVAGAQAPQDLLYSAVQGALRAAAADATLDEILGDRARLQTGLPTAVRPGVDEVGIVVDSVAVKDLMLPAELRRAQAETVLARERGRAELERARAEAASLRSLANTARLLEDHPVLLQLRTLDAASRPGATVVLRPPDGTQPATPEPPEPR